MNICVYGASSYTIDKTYINDGEALGRAMAKKGIGLVFGAGANGMMGAVARGASEYNGNIIGVVPTFFNADGIIYEHCTELIRTETMRQRKQIMEDRADAFIVTAGGMGTFEEFFEILTLKQLGRHNKPIAVLNTNKYYDSMQNMMLEAIKGNFMTEKCINLYKIFDNVDDILSYIENYNEDIYELSTLKNIDNGDSK